MGDLLEDFSVIVMSIMGNLVEDFFILVLSVVGILLVGFSILLSIAYLDTFCPGSVEFTSLE